MVTDATTNYTINQNCCQFLTLGSYNMIRTSFRIIQKINQGSSSLFVLVGIVVLFIKVNITKNKKTQKVKKLTFWVSGNYNNWRKCEMYTQWRRTLPLDHVSIKKWYVKVSTCDVPHPILLIDADVMYKAVKDCVQPRFSGDSLPSTWRQLNVPIVCDPSDVVTVQVNVCVAVLVNLNTCIVLRPVTLTCNSSVHLCFNLSHGNS